MSTEGEDVDVLSAQYVVGLTEGEGCFLTVLRKDHRVDLRFFISQAEGNKQLLLKLKKFFSAGSVYQKKSATKGRLPAWVFEVTKRDDIYNVIIPFFKKFRLLGYKAKSFRAFEKIAEVVKGRQDTRKLSMTELRYVTRLKLNMNKHYGSPGARKSHAGWKRASNLNKAQSVKSAKLEIPEPRLKAHKCFQEYLISNY